MRKIFQWMDFQYKIVMKNLIYCLNLMSLWFKNRSKMRINRLN